MPIKTEHTLMGGYQLTLGTYEVDGEAREMLTISVNPEEGVYYHIPFDQAGLDDIREKVAHKAAPSDTLVITRRMPTGGTPDDLLKGGRGFPS